MSCCSPALPSARARVRVRRFSLRRANNATMARSSFGSNQRDYNHSIHIASKARNSARRKQTSSGGERSPMVKLESSSGECECGEGGFADINGTKVSGALLRGLSLSNAAGETKVLSDVIGSEGKAVIVYLRHLG